MNDLGKDIYFDTDSGYGKNYNPRLWISWQRHVRSRNLKTFLKANYYEIVISGGRLQRYAKSLLRTIRIIYRERPSLLFIQNPSLVLAGLAMVLRKILKLKVVMDAHNAGLRPVEGKFRLLQCVANVLVRNADLVLVTNTLMAEQVIAIGGNAFILPDPLPSMKKSETGRDGSESESKFVVVAICSWAEDEPVKEILDAAKKFPSDAVLYCTGNPPQWAQKLVKKDLPTVVLTGFLSESDYVTMISQANCIIDLTNRDDCLVCGAYEAISVGVPFIVSDTSASRELFQSVGVLTANTASGIVDSVQIVKRNEPEVRSDVARFREVYGRGWQDMLNNLELLLSEL